MYDDGEFDEVGVTGDDDNVEEDTMVDGAEEAGVEVLEG